MWLQVARGRTAPFTRSSTYISVPWYHLSGLRQLQDEQHICQSKRRFPSSMQPINSSHYSYITGWLPCMARLQWMEGRHILCKVRSLVSHLAHSRDLTNSRDEADDAIYIYPDAVASQHATILEAKSVWSAYCLKHHIHEPTSTPTINNLNRCFSISLNCSSSTDCLCPRPNPTGDMQDQIHELSRSVAHLRFEVARLKHSKGPQKRRVMRIMGTQR